MSFENYSFTKEMALIEAILYLEGEPIALQAISEISGLSLEITEEVLKKLQEEYSKESSGIEISMQAGGYLIMPKKELWGSLKTRYGKRNEGKLSKAAMETLSIIAYSQPVTRVDIEAIREGINKRGWKKRCAGKAYNVWNYKRVFESFQS